ncbi:MAG: DNA alkylation repair protein [Deltaproteobacteria bacterium]|nr:DNA alkylation repair protein [Deltaproteobacteria bacterium]
MSERDNPKAFKHHLGRDAVLAIADDVGRVHGRFDRGRFVAVADRLGPLELKARAAAITEALHEALALPYPRAIDVVQAACPPPEASHGAFGAWPLVHYVGRFGLEHPQRSLAALRAMTATFSGEFDVRPYIVKDPDLALDTLARWVDDPSEHVRRLVSEGTRPRLPWGLRLQALVADPSPGLALIERLHADESEYVRRSVANHLNDVSKDHPARAVAVASRWLDGGAPTTRALVTHALRHLVKKGHAGALAALGHGDARGLEVASLDVPRTVAIGGHLALALVVRNRARRARSVVVDFAVHYLGARGAKAPKVFKLRTLELAAGAEVTLAKRHPMRHVSIRSLVPGPHRVDVQVNGVVLAGADFTLTPSEEGER